LKPIELTVDPRGNARVQNRAFAVLECREASRFLGRALGRSVSDQLTAESHQTRSDQA
jgi:hypothetical protein